MRFNAREIVAAADRDNKRQFDEVLGALTLLVQAKDCGVGEEAMQGHWSRARGLVARRLEWNDGSREVVYDHEGVTYQMKKLREENRVAQAKMQAALDAYDAFLHGPPDMSGELGLQHQEHLRIAYEAAFSEAERAASWLSAFENINSRIQHGEI